MNFTSGNTREQVADLLTKASTTLNTSPDDWTETAPLIERALELTRSVKAQARNEANSGARVS